MSQLIQQPVKAVECNNSTGKYRPIFFDLEVFKVSKAELNSIFYNSEEEDDDPELALLKEGFSFCYLREDKLRTIDAYDLDGKHIAFDKFLDRFSIGIKSNNLFKSGKYLSRVFRPVKYGGFYKDLDIHVNNNHDITEVDGISLISLELAKSLGWKDAKKEMSAQFTLFYSAGLIKGHCVVSDKISSDVVVYGKENIKSEITLNNGLQYLAVEPVKLSSSLRLDIQSMLNLWGLFGVEQYLEWANEGINSFRDDLLSGKLSSWLDNFESITPEDYDNEKWTLRKAIYSKIDYTKYPGLLRSAWTMYKKGIMTYASGSERTPSSRPSFRIPVKNGKRGYLRIDLRKHDQCGNFTVSVKPASVSLDIYGNAWMSNIDIEKQLKILGGADFDDGVAIIPVEDGKAVIYRNPNQYGEYIIVDLAADKGVFTSNHNNRIVGTVPQKDVSTKKDKKGKDTRQNPLLKNLNRNRSVTYLSYSTANLIKSYSKVCLNSTNIGYTANAEMILSVIGITNKSLFKKLSKDYKWSLERVIDSTVKDGTSAESEINTIKEFLDDVTTSNIALPKSLIHRLPKKLRNFATLHKNHVLDQLLDAIETLITETDLEIVGSGAVSKGNRIAGIIDSLETPIHALGLANVGNPYNDVALRLLGHYKRSMAFKMETTKEDKKKDVIAEVQTKLLTELSVFTEDERVEIANSWAYQIYKSDRAIHDSILWIRDMGDLQGTATSTIQMLANVGEGLQIKRNGNIERFKEKRDVKLDNSQIRVWSKDVLSADKFNDTHEILVEGSTCLIGDLAVNIGDECEVADGIYRIKSIAQSRSKRDSAKLLMKSIAIYLV
jgi:hypothetical protein